jgi:hypothetical protein
LEGFVVGNEGSKSSQGLTAGTTHTEKERVTKGLAEDTGNTGNVIASVQEENELHLRLGGRVEIFEVFLNLLDHSGEIIQVLVRPEITIHTESEIREDNSIVLKDLLFGGFKFAFGLVEEQVKEDSLISF